jgi:hypothetical protein
MNKSEKKLKKQTPAKVTPQKTVKVLPFDDGSKNSKRIAL